LAKKKGGGKTRKVKLTWYPIRAPDYLGNGIVGETPVTKFGSPIDRVMKIPLNLITGNIRHIFIDVFLRIVDVKDGEAKTVYWGHELTRDRVERMVRKRTSRVDVITDVKTKDGVLLRIKPLIITDGRADYSVQKEIRKRTEALLNENIPKMKLEEFLKDVFEGTLQKVINAKVKEVHPIRHVEIRKVEVLSMEGVKTGEEGKEEVAKVNEGAEKAATA